MKIVLTNHSIISNNKLSFKGAVVSSSESQKKKRGFLKNSKTSVSKSKLKDIGKHVLEAIILIWMASLSGLADVNSNGKQNQQKYNQAVKSDVNKEIKSETINSFAIEDVQGDITPELVLENHEGDKFIYNYLAEKTIEKQDGTVVVKTLISHDMTK